jgi:hypothetical protein
MLDFWRVGGDFWVTHIFKKNFIRFEITTDKNQTAIL